MSGEKSKRDQLSVTNDTPLTLQSVLFSMLEAVMAVIVWQLDLQLPVQSVPITTDVVSSNLD